MPFRQAHHAVGAVVARAEKLGKRINELTLAELRSIESRLDAAALKLLNIKGALDRRNLPGAPGTRELKRQLQRWKRRLG